MGLISKEVEVGLCSNNIAYYENLGYMIPRRKDKIGRLNVLTGTIIKINVLDLSKGSAIYVVVECDNCGIKTNTRWVDYKKCVKDDGKYYCHKCANKLYGEEKYRKTRLKNGISFEQWCINNNKQDVLNKWDYKLNDCKPSEILWSTNKKYYFRCPKGIHKSELKIISYFTNRNQNSSIKCDQCNSFAQWGIDNICEDFLEKYWDYELNTINPWEIAHASSAKKVYIKCQEKDYHESYKVLCKSFMNLNSRCPYCCNYHGKVHPLDSLGTLHPEVLDIWSDKNEKTPYEYSPFSVQKIWWKCPEIIHEDYSRSISNSNSSNFHCPECEYSKGEEKISNYFMNLGFVKINNEEYKILNNKFKIQNNYYIPQMKYNDLIGLGGGLLSYDFYLPNKQYNLLIEYDGEFHYMPIKKYKNEPTKYAEERLKKQQEHDKLKDEYTHNYNIKLLRIPYWDFDNIESILNKYFLEKENGSLENVILI